jgi:hypothetical protein
MEDGREICARNAAGRRIYRARTLNMRERQLELCCLCGLWMPENETTFEHEFGRTAGRHDDRITVAGVWRNGASHALCNGKRGSDHTPFNVIGQ